MDGQAPTGGPLPGDDGRQLPGPASEFGPALVPEPGWGPVCVPEDDGELDDLDEHFAWLVREIDAGRVQPPPESALEGPAVSVSLGDACDLDPGLLAGMCGRTGLAGRRSAPRSGRTGPPTCCAPARSSRRSPRRPSPPPGSLTDDELTRGAAGVPPAGEPGQLPADGGDRGVRPPPPGASSRRRRPPGTGRLPGRGVPRRGAGDGTGRHRPLRRRPDRHRGRADNPAAADPGRDGGRADRPGPGLRDRVPHPQP